jgi:hypothetical protein
MKIELTDQQQQAVREGRPVEVIDPATRQSYLIVPRDGPESGRGPVDRPVSAPPPAGGIPPGIRRSQEAYWRELPELLKLKSRRRRWVAYHGDRRIGFGRTSAELYRQCTERLGLAKSEFYVDRLEPRLLPPWEAEEIEASFSHGEATTDSPDANP